MIEFETYSAGGVDAGPLHGDSDAVEEYDDQHDMVKHFVGDDLIAQDPKPEKREKKTLEFSGSENGRDIHNVSQFHFKCLSCKILIDEYISRKFTDA